jgi:hypothetical protein
MHLLVGFAPQVGFEQKAGLAPKPPPEAALHQNSRLTQNYKV